MLLICHGLGEHSGPLPARWSTRCSRRVGGVRARPARARPVVGPAGAPGALRRLARRSRGVPPTGRVPPPRPAGRSCWGTAWAARSRWPTRWTRQHELAGLVLSAPALASDAVPRAAVPRCARLARVAPRLRPAGIDADEDQQGPGGGGRLPGRSAGAPRPARRSRCPPRCSGSSPCCPSGPARCGCRCCCSTAWLDALTDPVGHPAAGRRVRLAGPDRALVRGPLARDLPRAGARPPAGRPARLARGAPLTPALSDISTVREPRLPRAGTRLARESIHCGQMCGMSPAAVLGEIWGCRRADHFDQSVARADVPPVRSSVTTGALRAAARHPSCPHVAPTPLALADLTALTRRIAAEVPRRPAPGRTSTRCGAGTSCCARDDFVDVWLISWATEQAAELHDHAGSLGALTVGLGRLRRAALGRRRAAPARAAGRPQRGFPARARARRRQPGGRARGQRARLLAAADRDVLLRASPADAGRIRAAGCAGPARCSSRSAIVGRCRMTTSGRAAGGGQGPAGPARPAAGRRAGRRRRASWWTPARDGSARRRASCPVRW